MLIRKLKRGDRITVGDIVMKVAKATEQNLSLAIQAPEGVTIHQTRADEHEDKPVSR